MNPAAVAEVKTSRSAASTTRASLRRLTRRATRAVAAGGVADPGVAEVGHPGRPPAQAQRRQVDRVELPAGDQQVVVLDRAPPQLRQHAAVEEGERIRPAAHERRPSLGPQQQGRAAAAHPAHRAEGLLDVAVEAAVGRQAQQARVGGDHVNRGVEVAADLGRHLRLDQRHRGGSSRRAGGCAWLFPEQQVAGVELLRPAEGAQRGGDAAALGFDPGEDRPGAPVGRFLAGGRRPPWRRRGACPAARGSAAS